MKQYEELQKYVSSMVSEHQYEIGGVMKKLKIQYLLVFTR